MANKGRSVIISRRRSPARKRHHSTNKKISIAIIGGLAYGMVDPLKWAIAGASMEGTEGWGDKLLRHYTGFSPSRAYYGHVWDPRFMVHGAVPAIAGILIHKVCNRLGINRALKGIPFIQI